MYLNEFSARIPEGHECSGGYVEMEHNKQYRLVLRNDRDVRCDAEVTIDGKRIGTFRIGSHSSITLERPPEDQGRFTFFKTGGGEAQKAGQADISPNDRGLIKVTFTPERRPCRIYYHPYPYPYPREIYPTWRYTCYDSTAWSPDDYSLTGADYEISTASTVSLTAPVSVWDTDATEARVNAAQEGVTGLSGHSDQRFTHVAPLDYDYAQQTTIHLRLVAKPEKTEPRPLRPAVSSNPVPPPVK